MAMICGGLLAECLFDLLVHFWAGDIACNVIWDHCSLGAVAHYLVMERAKVLETRTNNGLFTNNDEKEEEDDEARSK